MIQFTNFTDLSIKNAVFYFRYASIKAFVFKGSPLTAADLALV